MSGTEKMITLIIPFYNCEDTIGKCLESVSNQTIDKDKLEV
ncbi:MAG TPA: glycosyl transferase, partial [Ruminococcaceae bacterium]|nr:glycosyl transferase [Oscillospiraceae bacterium]